jgi:hypothetical protein
LIDLRSAAGEGSAFSIYLPMIDVCGDRRSAATLPCDSVVVQETDERLELPNRYVEPGGTIVI